MPVPRASPQSGHARGADKALVLLERRLAQSENKLYAGKVYTATIVFIIDMLLFEVSAP